jgi:hypothetical protein
LVPAPRDIDATSDTATLETESDILLQVIQSDTAGLSPEAAQALLGFRFNTAAVARMNELAEKNREGTIAPSERARRQLPQLGPRQGSLRFGFRLALFPCLLT